MSAPCTPPPRPRPGWPAPLKARGPPPPAACSTPLLAFPGNDDEQERRQRRRSRVIDLQADASLSDSASHSAVGTPAAVPKLSNAQISEHYSTCIKLSTENKITTKNAFGLHLIDYMADILKQKDSELTNFKVAAGTLDASTKIYAVRVDAVHADAYRVLGGLGAETRPGEGRGPEEGGGPEEPGEAKVPRRRRPPKRTVEQNLGNINSPEAERRGEVDPMFQRMASSFDESSTAGVFLSVLFSSSQGALQFPSQLVLLQVGGGPAPPQGGPAPPPAQEVPAAPFLVGLRRSQEKSSICPSLQDFCFTSRSPEQTTDQLLERMKEGAHVFDVHAEPEPEDDGREFDADGDYEETEEEHREGCQASGSERDVVPIGGGDVSTMCLQLSSQPREYSYFSPRTMEAWAGPGYWRFKPPHRLDHVPGKEPRKRKPRKSFELDFSEDVNFDPYFRSTRASTTNSRSALSSSRTTTQPPGFQFPPEGLSQLCLKPSGTLVDGGRRLSGDLEDLENIGDYDYNNANDTANFCPGLQDGDSDEELEAPPAPPGGPPQDRSTYGEEDLVPEPHRVNKIEINYAKTAKKMDMKRLKSSMWTLLTQSPDTPAQGAEPKEKGAEPKETEAVWGEKVFSETTKSLLQRLPGAMAQNLSVPLAFVALLHLANEKNLELLRVDDMSDILIRQGL